MPNAHIYFLFYAIISFFNTYVHQYIYSLLIDILLYVLYVLAYTLIYFVCISTKLFNAYKTRLFIYYKYPGRVWKIVKYCLEKTVGEI